MAGRPGVSSGMRKPGQSRQSDHEPNWRCAVPHGRYRFGRLLLPTRSQSRKLGKKSAPCDVVLPHRNRADSKAGFDFARPDVCCRCSFAARRSKRVTFPFRPLPCKRRDTVSDRSRHPPASAHPSHLEKSVSLSELDSPRADDCVRVAITLSTSKGEDYEDVDSSPVDGSDRTRIDEHGKGGAHIMLRVRGLLRLGLFRLQVNATE